MTKFCVGLLVFISAVYYMAMSIPYPTYDESNLQFKEIRSNLDNVIMERGGY